MFVQFEPVSAVRPKRCRECLCSCRRKFSLLWGYSGPKPQTVIDWVIVGFDGRQTSMCLFQTSSSLDWILCLSHRDTFSLSVCYIHIHSDLMRFSCWINCLLDVSYRLEATAALSRVRNDFKQDRPPRLHLMEETQRSEQNQQHQQTLQHRGHIYDSIFSFHHLWPST